MRARPAVERFWEKVTPGEGDCWEWLGAKNSAGYARLAIGRGHVRAHRFAFELLVGPIPEGLVLDHLCRNRGCVNPKHLEPVTTENVRRGEAVKTHCIRGHELTDENVYVKKNDGQRRCRLCRNAWHRARRASQTLDREPSGRTA